MDARAISSLCRSFLAALMLSVCMLAPAGASADSPGRAALSARGSDPLAGMSLYVNPDSDAAVQRAKWKVSDPSDAAVMAKLAAQPTATWLTGTEPDVKTAVSAVVKAAARSGAVAELVAYDIPDRDCGGYSSGGAASAAAYEKWIDSVAAGIGSDRAIVILEPDALADLGCLSAAGKRTRLSLLRHAVSALSSHRGTYVYLDSGHYGWQTAAVMASSLKQAGIAKAQGFSLNVSNFDTTSSEIAYGRSISALTGNSHFVIDTSRNGAGGDGQWCNPPGRALGADPTTNTGTPLLDATLWIKVPGESDGTCNGGPAAGTWWPRYALALARDRAR